MKFDKFIVRAQQIIDAYPKSKNGHPYLILGNGKKLFFNRFVRKYGLDGSETEYRKKDVMRRLTVVEFFTYFLSEDFELSPGREKGKLILESAFHRMVIIEVKVGQSKKLELLSFYPLV